MILLYSLILTFENRNCNRCNIQILLENFKNLTAKFADFYDLVQ